MTRYIRQLCVHRTLPGCSDSSGCTASEFKYAEEYLPMRDENLPPIQHLHQWDTAIFAPVIQGGQVVDEDDKVV